jgi:serine/threonine protein kinase
MLFIMLFILFTFSPQNVLLGEHFVAKVSDFGLARVKDEAQSLVSGVVGTFAWMAPECLRGERILKLILFCSSNWGRENEIKINYK